MSRVYFSATTDYSVQANFTAWINGVHAGILGRFVQTADAGQIDPATVVVPAAGAFAGPCLYRTNDAIGAPFYLRLNYGRSASIRYCKLEVSVGTGTDGAGALTGNLSAVFTVSGVGDPGLGSFRSLVAGDAGRLAIINNADAGANDTNGRFGLSLSRTVDAAGAASARGMELFVMLAVAGPYNGNLHWQQFIPAPAYSPLVLPPTGARGAYPLVDREWSPDVRTYFGRTQTVGGPDSNYPNPYVLNYGSSTHPDFANNAIHKLTIDGIARDYFMIGGYNGAVNGQPVGTAICVS